MKKYTLSRNARTDRRVLPMWSSIDNVISLTGSQFTVYGRQRRSNLRVGSVRSGNFLMDDDC